MFDDDYDDSDSDNWAEDILLFDLLFMDDDDYEAIGQAIAAVVVWVGCLAVDFANLIASLIAKLIDHCKHD